MRKKFPNSQVSTPKKDWIFLVLKPSSEKPITSKLSTKNFTHKLLRLTTPTPKTPTVNPSRTDFLELKTYLILYFMQSNRLSTKELLKKKDHNFRRK
jgi:hypothetical protein